MSDFGESNPQFATLQVGNLRLEDEMRVRQCQPSAATLEVEEVVGQAWNAPQKVVRDLGYEHPVFRRTRAWLASERSRKTSYRSCVRLKS